MRVLMFSSQPILVRGLESILTPSGLFRLQAANGGDRELFRAIESWMPQVLMLDFTPEDDFGTLLALRQGASSNLDLKIILLVRKITPDLAHQAIQLGVRGILPSTVTAEQTLSCLTAVAAGDYWFDEDLRSNLYRGKTLALSPRESQLVILVSQGLKNKEISEALGISEQTVRTYLSALFRKLGLKDRYELALCGMRKLLGIEMNDELASSGACHGEGQLRFVLFVRPSRVSGQSHRVVPMWSAGGNPAGTPNYLAAR